MKVHVVLFLAVFVAFDFSARRATAEDLFPDKNLEAAVRQEVFDKRNKPDPLVEADVVNISQVIGKGKKITNLKGLEKCKSLQTIDLENNEIVDLSPLKDLKLLISLYLGRNKIENIEPLSEMTALQLLWIQDNQIVDIAPLAKMTPMGSLDLSNNRIKRIDALSSLPKIHALYLTNNPVEDFKPLAALKNLERLDLRGCGISDLSPLANHTEWRYLFLDNNKITDLSVLVEAAKKDFEGQKRFAPFWQLYVGNNPLSDEAKTKQLPEIKKYGSEKTVHLTYP
jgi:internalin A